jgi:hypothetical protein
MEWLTPLTALYAAAVSVPLLLLLYFLKLKRREQIVSSTLLWKPFVGSGRADSLAACRAGQPIRIVD